MIDFTRLTTPVDDGGILVEPRADGWRAVVTQNATILDGARSPILDSNLSDLRRWTRAAVGMDATTPLVVVGHQPEFMHAGVFAKYVAAAWVARRWSGRAINLVVDSDVPRSHGLRVPRLSGTVPQVTEVPVFPAAPGTTYEHLGPVTQETVGRFVDRVQESMPEGWDRSLFPVFVAGMHNAAPGDDWVDAMIAGRRRVERELGLEVTDVRVRDLPCAPFVADLLLRREEFAERHNAALADYRRRYRVRGVNRPMPDLVRRGAWVEVPFWLVRAGTPRRRCFARRDGGHIELIGNDDDGVLRLAQSDLLQVTTCEVLRKSHEGWSIRTRALALTLWARTFLADLFIHGIGGGKYDRITDAIMTGFYGIAPPGFVCVSATLCPVPPDGPPMGAGGPDHPPACASHADRSVVHDIQRIARERRDLRFNPQRYFQANERAAALLTERSAAIAEATRLRQTRPHDKRARRLAFERIRRANQALINSHPELLEGMDRRLRLAREEADSRRIFNDREFFFALLARERIERLQTDLCERLAFA